jgi:hypothetical protein
MLWNRTVTRVTIGAVATVISWSAPFFSRCGAPSTMQLTPDWVRRWRCQGGPTIWAAILTPGLGLTPVAGRRDPRMNSGAGSRTCPRATPRHRGRQPDAPSGWAGREGGSPESAAALPDEPGAGRSGVLGADGPGASRGARSEQSRVNRGGQPSRDRDETAAEAAGGRRGEGRGPGDRDDAGQDGRAPGPREAAGGAAAVAARLICGGQPRAPEQDARDRRADDALWARAAAQHTAAQPRRRARGSAAPSYPSARREPFRPWFTTPRPGRAVAERGGDRGSVVHRR